MAKTKKLDKDTIIFLRHYRHNLHADTETRANMRGYLKVNYPFENYMYIDLDIMKRAGALYVEYYGHNYGSGTIGHMRNIKRALIKHKKVNNINCIDKNYINK